MRILRFLLLPVSMIYTLVVVVRNFLFDVGVLTSQSYQLPLIGVGNLSMGGTGKSPHVDYLMNLLSSKFKLASLSRGYGRSSSGYHEVLLTNTFTEVGDEPLMLKKKHPLVTIAVDGNRRRGIKSLLNQKPEIDCILLDDSFQHRAIQPGLNILLTDYSKLYIDDLVLPTGSLREPKFGANRADLVIVTKCPRIFSPIDARGIRKKLRVKPYQAVFFSYFKYMDLKPVYHNNHEVEKLGPKMEVVLLTGIAKSSNLLYYVKDKVKHIVHHKYGDHHTFGLTDIQKLIQEFEGLKGDNKIILTTEKDAMRLHMPGIVELLGDFPVYYIPVSVEFHGKDKEDFEEQIMNYVRRYSKID